MSPRELRAHPAIYRFEQKIGEGRTGYVYRASREDHEGHSRQVVAVKIPKEKTGVSELRREFETLLQMSSPHCAKVLAWEILPEGPAIVLEWINGASLLELAKARMLRSEWGIEIVAQIQEGLQSLRARGLHHGDLSPANVLIDRDGVVKLVDFATSKSCDGVIHGTPAYLAPEIWSGGATSFAADLFALGLLEFDIETGFEQQPESHEACRIRSASLSMDQAHQLLSRSPADRRCRYLQSSSAERARMAEGVSRYLASKFLMQEHTAAIADSDASLRPSRIALSLGALFLTCAVSVRAQAPAPSTAEIPASLAVHSQKWVQVWLNGREAGYAPIEIRGLRPGFHRLQWKTAFASGSMRVKLNPGARVALSESALLRPGNR